MDTCSNDTALFYIAPTAKRKDIQTNGVFIMDAPILDSYIATVDQLAVGFGAGPLGEEVDPYIFTAQHVVENQLDQIIPSLVAVSNPRYEIAKSGDSTKLSIFGLHAACNSRFTISLTRNDHYFTIHSIPAKCFCEPREDQIPDEGKRGKYPSNIGHIKSMTEDEFKKRGLRLTTRKITKANFQKLVRAIENTTDMLEEITKKLAIAGAASKTQVYEDEITRYQIDLANMLMLQKQLKQKKSSPTEEILVMAMDETLERDIAICARNVKELEADLFNDVHKLPFLESTYQIDRVDLEKWHQKLFACQGVSERFQENYRHTWKKSDLDQLKKILE